MRYLGAIFPENTTYTPPALPTNGSVNLEPVTGVPSEEAIIKVQDAIRGYQQFSNVPSMFDPRVNMNLTQHLFDLQMARYTQRAGDNQATCQPHETIRPAIPTQPVGQVTEAEESLPNTNNAGTGANIAPPHQESQSMPTINIHELLERSNQFAERFNRLLERSSQPVEPSQPASQAHPEQLDRIIERLGQLLEQRYQPAEQSNLPIEHFNELFDRFNQLAEQRNRSSERSNRLEEQANECWARLGDTLRNVNKVLVRIQHAIVRSHKGNTISALDCLINEKGETPAISDLTGKTDVLPCPRDQD
ncbi:unnamed protein product [Rhizoctonia solani]|uniref:Laminin domain protein n=1 Tax=Rhizoctonia solani TaxID=456999 RepID=A0A8H3DZ20_9AGAM|nr:unnamed protein product [Rhizoctonia solani]